MLSSIPAISDISQPYRMRGRGNMSPGFGIFGAMLRFADSGIHTNNNLGADELPHLVAGSSK
jgi:hypothetical protein